MAFDGKIVNLFMDDQATVAFPKTKVKAISDDNGVGLEALLENKQEKFKAIEVTLTSAEWSNSKQSIAISGINENSIILVTPAPKDKDYCNTFGVHCSNQLKDTLEFSCSMQPTEDIVMNVLILN